MQHFPTLWCPHPLTLDNVVLCTPGHMSLLKLLLRPCSGSDLALVGGAGSPLRLLELCKPQHFHSWWLYCKSCVRSLEGCEELGLTYFQISVPFK